MLCRQGQWKGSPMYVEDLPGIVQGASGCATRLFTFCPTRRAVLVMNIILSPAEYPVFRHSTHILATMARYVDMLNAFTNSNTAQLFLFCFPPPCLCLGLTFVYGCMGYVLCLSLAFYFSIMSSRVVTSYLTSCPLFPYPPFLPSLLLLLLLLFSFFDFGGPRFVLVLIFASRSLGYMPSRNCRGTNSRLTLDMLNTVRASNMVHVASQLDGVHAVLF